MRSKEKIIHQKLNVPKKRKLVRNFIAGKIMMDLMDSSEECLLVC